MTANIDEKLARLLLDVPLPQVCAALERSVRARLETTAAQVRARLNPGWMASGKALMSPAEAALLQHAPAFLLAMGEIAGALGSSPAQVAEGDEIEVVVPDGEEVAGDGSGGGALDGSTPAFGLPPPREMAATRDFTETEEEDSHAAWFAEIGRLWAAEVRDGFVSGGGAAIRFAVGKWGTVVARGQRGEAPPADIVREAAGRYALDKG